MLTGSDGYQYEDLAQRLLGKPIDNARNQQYAAFRKASNIFTPGEIDAWYKAYDQAGNCPIPNHYVCHSKGLDAMHAQRSANRLSRSPG